MTNIHLNDPKSPSITLSEIEKEVFPIMRVRYWQHLINEMLKEKKFLVPIHLAFGHEASSCAINQVMTKDDRLCLTHRNISYNLARCECIETVLNHYLLTDLSKKNSHLGSMNLALQQFGVAYSSSILGNNLAVAAGIAMNRSFQSKRGIVFVITGDGAIEEGIFWEILIFAKSHDLGLVIIVENNDYSLGSTVAERRCKISLKKVCSGLDIKYLNGHGGDYYGLLKLYKIAHTEATQSQPICIEVNISSLCRHAGPTPGWTGDKMDININNGLMIQASETDPLHFIRTIIGQERYSLLEKILTTGVTC